MIKLHICGKDIYDRTRIFYSESTEEWWMGTFHDSCIIIKYCPFCGLELDQGVEMEWPLESCEEYHLPLCEDSSQVPF